MRVFKPAPAGKLFRMWETKQVLDSDTAYVMNRLLRGVMESDLERPQGTVWAAPWTHRQDPGTSSDNRDYWFRVLTPYCVHRHLVWL